MVISFNRNICQENKVQIYLNKIMDAKFINLFKFVIKLSLANICQMFQRSILNHVSIITEWNNFLQLCHFEIEYIWHIY